MKNYYKLKKTPLWLVMIFSSSLSLAQGVGINSTGANPSADALLDVSSSNKGMLIPRVSIANLANIAPITGGSTESLIVYNTNAATVKGYYYWDGSKWNRLYDQTVNGSDHDWYEQGTTTAPNSINDNQFTQGNVGIGVVAPSEQLHVAGGIRTNNSRINSGNDHLSFMQGVRADDNSYEWTGFYSGSTRQGIILYDGAWGGANGLTNEFGITAENGNKLTLNTTGNSDVALMPDGTGKVGVRTTSPTEELTVNGWIGRTAHNNGALAGSYNSVGANSAQTNPIYIIGSNYKPNATTLNNMYGIGYSHTGASFITDPGPNTWGLYVAADGDARIWLGASAGGVSYFDAGNVGIGVRAPSHSLHIDNTVNNNTLRLTGGGVLGSGARLNFGDGDFVYIDEPTDDAMRIHASQGVHMTNYLRVGTTSPPATTASGTRFTLFHWNGQEHWSAWSSVDFCGAVAQNWKHTTTNTGGDFDYLSYNNGGSRSRKALQTPWIWVPTGAASTSAEMRIYCNLEDGYDGVFLEYSTNGTVWTKVNAFSFGGYNGSANGSNTSCSGADAQTVWDGGGPGYFTARTANIPVSGTWVRLRFMAMEDGSNATGDFRLFGFNYSAFVSGIGGGYATGNIYAQNNIYAGSNVLLGDMAEYFPLVGGSEPGDLISMNPDQKDVYKVSDEKYDNYVIGVHSTNPTLTLNDPNSGIPVALRGRVPVKVCLESGPIEIGDFLTASSRRGYAMKAVGACYVVGRALGSFENNKGGNKVLCLIENTWYKPDVVGDFQERIYSKFIFAKRKKELIVRDASIGENSMIFLTMQSDPGSLYWVSDVKNGSFKLNFKENTTQDVVVNYLIENARSKRITTPNFVEENQNSVFVSVKEGGEAVKTTQSVENDQSHVVRLTEIPLDVNVNKPSAPAKPDALYKWTPDGGVEFVKTIVQEEVEPKRKEEEK